MKGTRSLTDSEYRNACNSFSGRYATRDRALFVLCYRTGFRVSEALSLQIGDVLQYGKIVERVSVERRHTKGKRSGRTVPLHREAREALAHWLEKLRADGHLTGSLFRSQKGGAMTRVQAHRVYASAFDMASLQGKLGTHCARKSFAQRMYSALDRDLIKTQRALGHANVNSTVSYLDGCEHEVESAILDAA